VLSQVRITEDGERILELTEEGWDGNQLFHEEVSIPLKEGKGPASTRDEIIEKRDAYWSEKITQEEFLHYVLNQLQREDATRHYEMLLHFYWKVRREDYLFNLEYVKSQNKAGYVPEALLKLIESVDRREEERKRKKIQESEDE
jgi:hypothetical protein